MEQITAQLIEVKQKILLLERQIQELFLQFGRKQQIDFERPNDYGYRGFNLQIFFDEFNIEAFDNSEQIKNIWNEWIQLRKKQRKLEVNYDSEIAIKKNIKEDMGKR